jgi:hypothetical protein
MTLAITPKATTNKLKIEVVAFFGTNFNGTVSAALFQDSTANALAAGWTDTHAANECTQVAFTHYMTAGTTSPTTFKFRAGPNATGTVTFNGYGGARKYGGVMASSITITEIKV